MNDDLHRVFLRGGVTSPGELKDIIAMLEAAGHKEVFFGSRQDLLFPPGNETEKQLRNMSASNTRVVSERQFQNIVCSYVSADIFEMTYWLKGSTYLYILEGFDYLPELKINITDPKQRLVPLFSGNLNFIASQEEDYWYLHIKLPHWQASSFYPVLIYSWDIARLCKAIEAIYQQMSDVRQLFSFLSRELDTNNKQTPGELSIPFITFPYYEGMNRMGLDQYWLGLYWRNNRYDLEFLKALCGFCLDNSIGKICITPWKSFIVKGIKQHCRQDLERLLGQFGINIRHSQLEMNWHLPVDDKEALELKQFLVRSFDQNDISTYGLTFGISNDVGKRSHFSAVILEKNKAPALVRDFKVRPTYNVLHFRNFDPNTLEYKLYAQDVDKIELPGLLMELSKKYFRELGVASPDSPSEVTQEDAPLRIVCQCAGCQTVYDSRYGDPKSGIEAGLAFSELPETYECPVCAAPKSNFLEKEISMA